MSVGVTDVLMQDYERAMSGVVEPQDDPLFGGALGGRSAALRRPAAGAPWAPTSPRPSGALRRPTAPLPHLADAPPRPDPLALPPELAARFRTLCALRAADPARVIEGLVRSYVILGLAEGGGR
ncbi:MAG: hypothetical protein M9894_30630 [Planctomycetes bacterium]|nr:hypothetical protein [Planctomycetota bacterium]